MKNILLFFTIVLLSFQSCRKDEVSSTTTTGEDPVVENKYVVNVHGQIFDQDNSYLENVKIAYGEQEVFTNEYGLFTMNEVKIGASTGTFLEATLDGYFDGGIRIYVSTQTDQDVKIVLIKKDSNGLINSSTGGEYSLTNGGKLVFEANSFYQNGSEYQGEVRVFAYYLDPSERDFLLRSPGDLSAINSSNELVTLQSFGMMAVELEGENGEDLNITSGKTVTIHMPIPNDLLADAANEIPLWHFDEVANRWKEEGFATLSGNEYIGEVSHFSWWNCDIPFEYTTLCLTLTDENSSPLQDVLVSLVSGNFGIAGGISDINGTICGPVPTGETFEVIVWDYCGEAFTVQEIGPYDNTNQFETISLGSNQMEYFSVSGVIQNCDMSEPLAGAYVLANIGNGSLFTVSDENGNYLIEGLFCQNTQLDLTGIDYNTGLAKTETIDPLESQDYMIDLNLCDLVESMVINVGNSGNYVFDNCIAKVKPNEIIVTTDDGNGVLMGIEGNGEATFAGSIYAFSSTGSSFAADNSSLSVTITSYGDVGEFITGTLEGTSGIGESISGTFTALREE